MQGEEKTLEPESTLNPPKNINDIGGQGYYINFVMFGLNQIYTTHWISRDFLLFKCALCAFT